MIFLNFSIELFIYWDNSETIVFLGYLLLIRKLKTITKEYKSNKPGEKLK